MRSAILRALDHVMGDRERGGAHILHRGDDQIVDDVGHDGIEARGRLVEEDDLRIGGDGARQAHALLHAAGQFRRATDRRHRWPRPTLASFSMAMSRALRARHAAALDQAEGDILPDRQAVEQRRALKQHAEFLQHRVARARRADAGHVLAIDQDRCPRPGVRMPRMHLIVTDLPVPEPPMITSEDCLLDGQIDAVQHHLGAEALLDADAVRSLGCDHAVIVENRMRGEE